MKNLLKKIVLSRSFFLFVLILIVILVLVSQTDKFLTIDNIKGLLLTISIYGIIVTLLTVVFISGGFDVSVGSVYSMLGVVLGMMLERGVPVYLSIIIVLLSGAIIGASIGLLITKVGLSPFVATLGYYYLFYGLSFFIAWQGSQTNVYGIPGFSKFPESFLKIAGGTFHGIEYIIFYMIAVVVIFQILLYKNAFFRQNYYVGTNENSARVVGIKVNILKIFNYTILAVFVGAAAILRASNVGAAIPGIAGLSFPMTMIAAVILGGGNFKGGTGSITGSILAVILITLLNNSMAMLGINPYYNDFILGGILLFSILLNRYIGSIRLSRVKSY